MSKKIVYLLRHGEFLAQITREFLHKKVDYSLTELGVRQSQITAKHLKDEGICAVTLQSTEVDCDFTTWDNCAITTVEFDESITVGKSIKWQDSSHLRLLKQQQPTL